MTYAELLHALYNAGYQRIERDDRLLDVFPAEDREKGIELWEKWEAAAVKVLRVRLPFQEKHLQLFVFERTILEQLLHDNVIKDLDEFPAVYEGTAVVNGLSRTD